MQHNYKVVEENMETLHAVGKTAHDTYAGVTRVYGELQKGLADFPIAGVLFQCLDKPEEYDNPTHTYYCAFASSTKQDVAGFEAKELTGGKFLTCIHKGPYDRVTPAYEALSKALGDRQVRYPPFELYLNDPKGLEPEEFLTKVCFPVE